MRHWTYTFFTVLYTSKYLEMPDDPQVTLVLANHLYATRERCEQHADIADFYFTFLRDLFEEIWSQSNLIDGYSRLKDVIGWLEQRVKQKESNDVLLKGYLDIAAVFVKSILPSELESISDGLIRLLNEIIFPASPNERRNATTTGSNGVVDGQLSNGEVAKAVPLSPRKLGSPLCDTKDTVHSAMNLFVELTKGSPANLRQLGQILQHNWHSEANLNNQFDHYPSSQRRSKTGYVGLKNGGATCYLNAVTQQLFMIPRLRNSVLSAQLSEPAQRQQSEKNVAEKQYRYRIFNIFQRMIGHLASSEQTFFVPRQFWDNLKLCGALINVRDQQDAMEYYSQIVDTLDEAMKDAGEVSAIQENLMGTFSDQKICRDCPHRYSREEPFSSISVDVRSQHSLEESLAQFVKGDLLAGENAYFCEECQAKVAAIKRLCIGKLPTYLCIQLKRFDYDWEREEAIKFNDYFEFPRALDMGPYTAQGIENQHDCPTNAAYRLKGVVVHSGQASGGHYYAFIRDCGESGKWLKFDDCDVSEIELTDEELASQCFGGDQGEIWDNRRNSYRRGRRWWNAYLLFYENMEEVSINDLSQGLSDMSVNSSNSESFCVPQVDRRQVPPIMPRNGSQTF